MGFALIVGPANSGKVGLLLDRYLAVLDQAPVLIVPNRPDVERVERALLTKTRALFGGTIGTFDDVFSRIARGPGGARPLATEAQRSLALRRAVASAPLNGLGRSAGYPGFVDTLGAALVELAAGLVEPDELDGDLAVLYRAYRSELDRLGLHDRELIRADAITRLTSDVAAWRGQPVFAYGFEDLTETEWRLLEALAGRAEVTASLPYQPGRIAFASLQETATDVAGLADGRIEELEPAYGEISHAALAHLERTLFEGGAAEDAPPIEGAIRFLEGAGTRGVLELVGDEVLELMRRGTAPEQIGIVVPSVERWRAAVETVFGALGIPHSIEARRHLSETSFGHALVAFLRYAWLDGGRSDLFTYLRSPFSGLARSHVDFVEGRLRGRAVTLPERVEETMHELRGAGLPQLDALRSAGRPVAAVRDLAQAMLRSAFGVNNPPVGAAAAADLRAYDSCARLIDELEVWERLDGPLRREEVVGALERANMRPRQAAERGSVAVLDLMRARTRHFEVVLVLGLEEGSLPRRGHPSPFLDEDVRRRLAERLRRRDQVSYDRYLFYTACTRPSQRLYLVREAATDEGSPREPSPFWEEAAACFPASEVARWTRRRTLSQLTWPIDAAPNERERLRALTSLAAADEPAARSLASANGWERRLARAQRAFRRRTKLRHPLVLAQLGARTTFPVTELERFADCSSAWFVDRVVDPRTIDAEVDAKLRGQVAHTTLSRFFSGLPKELGTPKLQPEQVEDAVRFMRSCLDGALEGVRMEMTPMQRRELEQGLWRDLEQLVRDEAEAELPLEPRHFEVSFGMERSPPELQRGLELGEGLTLSGKIDRIDVDPFSARGIVQDYKSGKGAHSARAIERELRLQIPLYMLVLRDLVGIEPLGGLYRPLAGGRRPRGLLRAGDDALPGYAKSDYLDDEAFWGQVERARESARQLAGRIRGGDVRHDPRGDECPPWCDLWSMCRVRRA
jgi:ATP-dependent helicase/DNAse subunit B